MSDRFRKAYASAQVLAVKAKRRIKKRTPAAIQLAGLAAITGGFFVIAPWAGLIVGGILLCAVGWAYDDEEAVPDGSA